MKKSRNLFWDKLFGGNDYISAQNGTDVHLFTVSASNQAHVDVTMDETVDAVNVFNGLAGAQIALTANSNIWQGKIDSTYKCVGEMFWDWWLKDKHALRYGVPHKKFDDLNDYFLNVLKFSPVYVKRGEHSFVLPYCNSFLDYYSCDNKTKCENAIVNKKQCAINADNEPVKVKQEQQDIDEHFTFFLAQRQTV
ncbi:gamma-glutamylcysteine synthetase [Candidatus Magnetoovum chiemensis]|nr:gamma-glutamylcysteine synthetase [Candidatus Magnetoovum chiemensis]